MPWTWSEVWRLCNALIDDIKYRPSRVSLGLFYDVLGADTNLLCFDNSEEFAMVLRVFDELPDFLKAGSSGRPLTAGQGVRTFAPAC
jgi:hypothetical protein